ncbi:MAG: Ig-like domain-containing protein [bacterium]|nr:Ig-like domain-containing protein [bacterium]
MTPIAHAAITEQAPVFDGFFENNPTIGGGAIMPLVKFRLSQASDGHTLTKVGVTLVASSTMANGSISRLSLWKESGTKPGFQLDSDTFLAGAASTTVTTGLLTVLQIDAAARPTISVTGDEFFIVASTTAVSGLTNGHGFNVQMDANYASTSALTGVGTAFLSNRKVSLNQSGTLKISEVRIGSAASPIDEFIELYNSGEADINLQDLPLRLHKFYDTGSSSPISITYEPTTKVIPSHGYFLITNPNGYNGTGARDARFATSTFNVLVPNGGFSIATSSTGTMATSTAIDFVGWGTQGIGNCENTEASETPCVLTLLENGASIERLATGYPTASSTAATLTSGGIDAAKGNGFDKNFNKTDFVLQSTANPQNSLSPIEFSFGGGSFDMSSLQVQGSYPSNGQTSVPADLKYIGFGFSKPVNSDTIASVAATTTVTLFKVVSGGPSGSNLCSSVSYNPMPGSFEPQVKCNLTPIAAGSPNTLEANISYVFTVTSGVKDLSGNQLDQDGFTAGSQYYTATSTTGGSGQSFTNVTPPRAIGTSPFNGSLNIPTNLSIYQIEFSQASMDTTTFTASTVKLYKQVSGVDSTQVTVSSYSFATSTGKNILTLTLGSSLAANSKHHLIVTTGVKSSVTPGIPLFAQYESYFETGASADATAPAVIGVLPTNETTIAANTSDFIVIFDDALDTSTATSGAITLGITNGPSLPGSVRYDPVSKEVHFVPSNILPVGQNLTLTLKSASIKNASGVYLASPNVTKTWTVEATNTDTTAPSVLYGNVDEFSVAITFNEAVNSTDATNLSNYSLVVGGTTQTPSALAGHSITYDASTRTAKLTGLRLTAGAAVTATVTNIKDVSGNLMTSSSASATVSSSTGSGGSGGFVGPGGFTGSTFGEKMDFSGAGIGFMPPVNIRPSSTFISASSTYAFELPLSKQIDAGGTIVITLPSTGDFGLCCIATTSTKNPFLAEQNRDINGPGTGTIGITTITKDTTAKTITLTLSAATTAEGHDFLRFSLADMKNPSIPKGIDSSGYSIDIKSKSSAGTLLETFSANPLYITGGSAGGGSTTQIRGTITGDGGNLEGVLIHLMSPQTGPLDATTASDGTYSFTDLPVGSQFLTNNFGGGSEYYLFTDPFVNPTNTATDFFGNTMPTPIQATSTSLLKRDFNLTPTSSAINFTVNLSASAATFSSTETVDVFAGGPGQFVVKTVTPGVDLLTNYALATIPIPQTNGSWGIGIGPAMPKGTGGGSSGAPTAPSWSPPRPVEVVVSGCPAACTTKIGSTATTSNNFTISTADKSIVGILKDGSGNAIANAMVFAYSGANGTGGHAQTSSTGVFTVKVVSGSYVLGAFSPGVGKSREIPVVVDSTGVYFDGSSTASASFTLTMTKPGYTITGQVTDGSSAVGNASVFAYRTDGFGRADAVSDSSTGNYTMYVDNGTWKVSSFIPGFGPMDEQTVTVASANKADINFAPSSSQSFSLYSGNIYDDANNNNIFATSTEGLVGAVIRLSGANGVNEGISGAEGAFSIRVKSGTGYTITDVFMPGYGRIAPLDNAGTNIGTLNLTASSTNNYIRVPKRNTITISVKDSNGSPITVQKAFIDLFNTTTKQGSHVEITNATTTTIQVATGTSPTIRAYVQGVPPSSVTVSSDDSGTSVSSNVVTIDSATEAIKIVVNTSSASFSQVSGKVYKTAATSGNELEDTWIQFIDETNGVHFGTQATTSGAYSVNASNGTYQVIVSKSGYIGTPLTVTVSGTTTQNFILDSASLNISGTVTAGGTAAADAFVRAEKVGGGQAITQTATDGTYSLSVTNGTWKVFATAEGYSEGAASGNPITVSGSSVSGKTVALTTAVSLQSKLATSNTFTDTAAGTFTDSTVGVNVELDSNSLGAAGNSSYITAKETSNIPNTASVNVVASKAKDINAYSGGSQVKNLQAGKTASVDLTYTKAEMASSNIDTTTEVSNLKMVSYSEDKKEWEALSTVATYKDDGADNIVGNADDTTVTSPAATLSDVDYVIFTAVGTHFSAYALSSPTGAEPPSTPGSLTATPGAAVGGAVALTWGSSSGASGYYIYRDTSSSGTFALYVDISSGSTLTYSDSSVTGGTTYHYKIAAYADGGSQESSASSAVSATVNSAGGGGSPSGGGGGGASSGPPPRAQRMYPDGTVVYLDDANAAAKIKELDAKFDAAEKEKKLAAVAVQTKNVPAETKAQANVTARAVSPVFSKDLAKGTRGDDVKRLQELLGVESSGFFGPLTEKALKTFQLKHGVIKSEKGAGAGKFGPATRAKFKEVFEGKIEASSAPAGAASASATTAAGSTASGPAPTITRRLGVASRGNDVKALQAFLGVEATGYFGPMTRKAVQEFQEKYGIAKKGDQGYGDVGPLTRTILKGLSEPKP